MSTLCYKGGETMAFGAKIKLTVDSSKPGNFHKEIQSYVDAAASEKNPVYIHSIKLAKNSTNSLLSTLRAELRKDNNLVVKIHSIDASPAIKKLRGQLETMLSGLNIGGLKDFLGTDGVETTYAKAAESAEKYADAVEKIRQHNVKTSASLKELNNIQSLLTSSFGNISKFDQSTLKKINDRIQDAKKANPDAQNADKTNYLGATAVYLKSYEELNARIQELRSNESLRTDEAVRGLANEAIALKQNTAGILEKIKAEKDAAKAQQRSSEQSQKTLEQENSRRIALRAQITRWVQANGKAYKTYKTQIDELFGALESGETPAKEIRDRFTEISTSAKAIGVNGNTFFETFKKGIEKFGGWSIVTKSFTMVLRKLRDMITAVKELDAALTELKKVTNGTEETYNNFVSKAANMARAAGSTLTDTVNATADFARLGYSMDEAASLAEAALIYKNVGDGIKDVSEASESLISTIKAFGIEANDVMTIIDKFNEVGNNFAISSEGIGTALQKSASSLAAAGNSLDESVALITGMNSVVQDPEIVGTALKTLSMYLRAAKTDAEAAGEATDGMASSVSELRDQLLTLTKGKVDIMIDSENFKSTYQIMKELASVWEDLSDIDTANILELIGGKRNATAVTSLLKNFQDAEDALQTAQNSEGSALAENEKQLDSISGKVAVLNASFEELSNKLISSDVIKWLADVANALLKILNFLGDIKFLLPALTAAAVAFKGGVEGVKLQGLIGDLAANVKGLINKETNELTPVGTYYLEQLSGLSDHQKVILTQEMQMLVNRGRLASETQKTILATYNLNAAQKTLAGTGTLLGNTTTYLKNTIVAFGNGVKAAFKSNPVGFILTVISFIPTIVSFFKSFHESSEEIIQKAEEASQAIKKITSTLKENEKTVDELGEKYAKLAQGVDIPTGKNISLTDDEYKEFLDISEKLSGVFPSLTRVYDENGNAIIQLDGNVNTITNSLKNLLEVQREIANQELADNLKDLYKGSYEKVKKYKNNKNDAGKTSKAEALEKGIQNLENVKINLDRYISEGGTVVTTIFDTLSSDAYDLGVDPQIVDRIIQHKISKWSTDSNEHNRDLIEDAADEIRLIYSAELNEIKEETSQLERAIKNEYNSLAQSLSAWLYTDIDYKVLSDQAQSAIQRIVSNPEYLDGFKGNFENLTDSIKDDIISVFSGSHGAEVTKAVADMLSLDTKFQDGTIMYNQFVAGIEAFKNKINSLDLSDEQLSAFEKVFKIDFDSDKIVTDYDALVGKVKSKISTYAKDLVDTLSYENLMIAANLEVPTGVILSWDELLEKIKEYKNSLKEIESPLSFVENLSNVQKLSEGLDQLSKIYKDVSDGEDFDWSNILNNKNFKEAFGDLGEEYNNFIKTVANSPVDIQACQNAFNSLVGAYINGSGIIGKLTDETRDATVAFLEQNGVVNAAEIADHALAIQKEKLQREQELGIDATYEEISAKFELAESGSVAQEALARLALEKLKFNKTTISSSKDVDNIINIANAARIATSDVEKLARAKDYFEQMESIKENSNMNSWEKSFRLSNLRARYLNSKDVKDIIEGTYEYNYNPINVNDFKYVSQDKSSKKSNSASSKDTQKTVNWIETIISRITTAIEKLKSKASDIFSSFSSRIKATGSEIEKVTRLIDVQRQAYNEYMKKADSINLSEELKNKVRNGAFEITDYNSDVQQKISDFQEWYEKALACSDEIETLRGDLNSLYKDQFDLTASSHSSKLGLLEIEAEKLNSQLDRLDERGFVGTTRYYEALRNVEVKTLEGLREEYDELSKKFNDGTVVKYSESWYDLNKQIADVAKSISESETALVSFDNKMREVVWDRYDYMQDKLSEFKDESEFYLDLLGDDLYNKENNELNNKGLTALGLHGLNYDVYISEAKSYAEEIKKIESEIEKSPGDDNLIQRKKELVDAQRDCIKAAQDEKQAMIDLVKDGIQAQIDALKELIDKYTSSLDSAKDLYEYQQNINNQVKNIASLRKQLSAYENDSSDETRAKVQKLKVSLEDAQRELQESQYDRYVSDQKELLDSVYEEYQNFLNSRFDNIDKSFEELIDRVNVNADIIGRTLEKEAEKHGVKLSDSMSSVWNSESKALDGYLSGNGIVLNGITGLFDNTNSELSGINTALTGIAEAVNQIVLYASAQAKSDIDPEGAKNEMKRNSINWWASDGTDKNRLSTSNNAYGNALGYIKNSNGEWIDPKTGNNAYTVTTDDKVRAIISKMKLNSSEWNSASVERRKTLEAQNNSYAQTIANLLGQKVTKDGNGVWWIGNKKLYSYRTGGLVSYTGLAQLDGTPGSPELVLNASDTKNFIELKEVLRDLQNKKLLSENIMDSAYYDFIKNSVALMSHSISELPRGIRDGIGSSNSSIRDININIPIERVEDYNDFVNQLSKDKKFERYVQDVVANPITRKNSLGKNKYKW